MQYPFIRVVALLCASLATIPTVVAVPMIESANSTQMQTVRNSVPDNPFNGITINFGHNSLTQSIVERTAESELDQRTIAVNGQDAAEVIFSTLKAALQKNRKVPSQFALQIVNEGRKLKSGFNFIACNTKHRTEWKGTRGLDWGHQHIDSDTEVGGTSTGYEVYFAKEGEFWNLSDGNANNCVYAGNFKADGKSNKHIIFSPPK